MSVFNIVLDGSTCDSRIRTTTYWISTTEKYVLQNRGDGGMYQTLEDAKSSCDSKDNCIAIEDTGCTHNNFFICRTGSTFSKSKRGSCVYAHPQAERRNKTRSDNSAQGTICEDRGPWCKRAHCSFKRIKTNC